MNLPTIEVCVESLDGLVAAQEARADRVELCAALSEGGVTPSLGTVRAALRAATIPVHVLVRPRGGDFLYSELEFESLRDDVAALARTGAAAVAVGCLRHDGAVDESRTSELVRAAGGMSVTFHRAFDMTRDPEEALGALIRCGVNRVLTSGRHPSALEGAGILARTVAQAAGKIGVVGCGRIRAESVVEVLQKTALREIHFAPLRTGASGMLYRNPRLSIGATAPEREYLRPQTDPEAIRALIEAIRRG